MTNSNYHEPSSPVGDLLQSEFHPIPALDLNNGQAPPKSHVFFPTGSLHDKPKLFHNTSPKNIGSQTVVSQPEVRFLSQQSQLTPSHSPYTRSPDNTPDSPSSLPEFNFDLGRKDFRSSQSATSKPIYSGTRSQASSGRSSLKYHLDDPTFAPSPLCPNSELNSSHSKKSSSILPSFDKITHSGHMQARTSLKDLLIKKWKPIFWITYDHNEVYIFRSKVDFEEWATNPYLSTTEREAIVKLKVDFKLGSESNLGVKGFRTFSLQPKSYGRSGTMYTFKLEQWMHYGPVVLGAFASTSKSEVGAFYTLCKEMIKVNKSSLSEYLTTCHQDDSDIQSQRSHRSTRSTPNTSGFY